MYSLRSLQSTMELGPYSDNLKAAESGGNAQLAGTLP